MEPISFIFGLMGPYLMLFGGQCFGQRKKILQGRYDNLCAKMKNTETRISPSRIQCGTKRQRDNDLSYWRDDSEEPVSKARSLSSQGGDGSRSFFKRAKLTLEIGADALEAHDKKGDKFLKNAPPVVRGPRRVGNLPVKQLIGEVASTTLNSLKLLLQDEKVGRVVIHGVEGVGKTCLMKHLYNNVLNWVDRSAHVFWVTFPDHCTIINLQDAVAAAVKCEFASNDNLCVRARKLSDKLAGLGSFVLFLDGVPGADFSLDEVGISLLCEGSKLVATTSCTLKCRLLDGFKAVKVDPLSIAEAYELFTREARIDLASNSSLGDTPLLLAARCRRLPRAIVDVGNSMCGIDDPREWNCALYES